MEEGRQRYKVSMTSPGQMDMEVKSSAQGVQWWMRGSPGVLQSWSKSMDWRWLDWTEEGTVRSLFKEQWVSVSIHTNFLISHCFVEAEPHFYMPCSAKSKFIIFLWFLRWRFALLKIMQWRHGPTWTTILANANTNWPLIRANKNRSVFPFG